MKKIFAIIMSVLMIACFMPTMAFAAPETTKTWNDNGKFRLELESDQTKATAEVYNDYTANFSVTGDIVNAASVKVGITMKNINGLGLAATEKSANAEIKTGISDKANLPLQKYFPHIFGYTYAVTSEDATITTPAFAGGTITGVVDDKDYQYTLGAVVKSSGDNNKNVYTMSATPSDSTKAGNAWKKLVGYISMPTGSENASKLIIKAGTTIEVGTSKVTFGSDCSINSDTNNISVAYTNAPSVETVDSLSDGVKVKAYLPAGTRLLIAGTSIDLSRGVYIVSDIAVSEEAVKGIQSSIKTLSTDKSQGAFGLVANLVKLGDSIAEGVDTPASVYINVKGEYKLTINYANGTLSETKSYAYGDTITLPTAPAAPVGQTFDHWQDASGRTVTNSTTITSDMTITPIYRNSSSGGSSGGGGGAVAPSPSTTDNVTNKTETKTDSSQTGTETTTTVPTTTATVKTETKTATDGTKTTTATVDTTTAAKIVEKAVENKSEEVVVSAAATPVAETAAGTTTEVAIPAETVSQIAEKTTAAVTIESEAAKVTLDQEAVAAVAEAAGETGTVSLVVETKAQDETRVEVDLKIETSNGTVSDFKGGTVSVTVKLNSALASKPVICVYIDDNGVYHKVQGQKNADGTYTFQTGHFSTYAIMSEEEANAVIAQQNEKVKELTKDMKLKASSSKTKKGNIKVKLSVNADEIKAIEDLGYTVKYKFYRSTKKSSSYKAKFETAGKTYTNTSGKKGTRYYYKARVMVYDTEGTLIAKTALKQCKYATRVR